MAMLPTAFTQSVSLAGVLAGCLAALERRKSALILPPVDATVVVLVDGLGALPLKARAGHARTIAPRLSRATTIDSGFPTTTAAALATLCTGAFPGRHGLIGYVAVDPETDAVFDHLSGWRHGPDPATWQRRTTLFEQAAAAGIRPYVVGSARYASTNLTQAVHRGAAYVGAKTMTDRVDTALALMREAGRSLVFLYVPELDMAAHQYGWQSPQWTAALEELDAAVAELDRGLRRGQGALLTADHGMIDVTPENRLRFDAVPELVAGVRHVAGDFRTVQLHLEAGASEGELAALKDAWQASEGGRAWVATRDEAIAAGWFGPDGVDAEVLPRIGDLLVSARAQVAYYDGRSASEGALAMVGQHGGFSPDEVKVPLIGLGAFAN